MAAKHSQVKGIETQLLDPTFDILLSEWYDATLQNLPVNPRPCPLKGAGLCTYNAWSARPAIVHPKTVFGIKKEWTVIVYHAVPAASRIL